ncbi:MAG: metallophosphoesterase [Desulfomonile tiedjei]|nr:metallophosphoesterase [Desulfomonile tiedjei]
MRVLCSFVMRLAHISDLHFGHSVNGGLLRSFGEDLASQNLDLLVITGDITDRGRLSQFRRARAFLDSLEVPYVSVPGNREVAISAFWEWTVPSLAMRRYEGFFGKPDRVVRCHEESRVALFGLNSVHFFPSWPGTVARATRYWLKEAAARLPDYRKILFLHHPVIPVIRGSSFWAHSLSDAGEILNICTSLGFDLILQGHKHRASILEVRVPEREATVVVCAGGAPLVTDWDTTYHVIDILESQMVIRPREYLDAGFRETGAYRFKLRT